MKKNVLTIAAIVAMFALNSCKPSDEKITEEVKKVAMMDASLSPVSYSIKEGVLTLSGEVESEELKTAAESKLKEIKGIKSVVNNITVKPAIVLPTAEELQAQANAAFNSVVTTALAATGVTGITSTMADSVVTLTGDVKKADLKKVMQAVMGTSPKKVDNKLNIIK